MQINKYFEKLITNAKLNNKVSAMALKTAHHHFKHYQKTKDLYFAGLAFDNINVIVRQITLKNCRIEPTQWDNLCSLHIQLYYLANNINPEKPAINDDVIDEVM